MDKQAWSGALSALGRPFQQNLLVAGGSRSDFLSLLGLSSGNHNDESAISTTRIVISTTGLHLSVESNDGADRSIISAVTVKRHHHPHPGLEGALKASRNASWILLPLEQLPLPQLPCVNLQHGPPRGAWIIHGPAWASMFSCCKNVPPRVIPQQPARGDFSVSTTWHCFFTRTSETWPDPLPRPRREAATVFWPPYLLRAHHVLVLRSLV